jgi:hypothetical protein
MAWYSFGAPWPYQWLRCADGRPTKRARFLAVRLRVAVMARGLIPGTHVLGFWAQIMSAFLYNGFFGDTVKGKESNLFEDGPRPRR